MDRNDLKISIVTPSFNSEGTIGQTIRSVLDQTFRPFEYIVIDGHSDDDTVKVVQSFTEEFEKKGIKLIVVSEKD